MIICIYMYIIDHAQSCGVFSVFGNRPLHLNHFLGQTALRNKNHLFIVTS